MSAGGPQARGRFITIEGGEGAGKSTQAAMLGAALEEIGVGCTLTREPGGSPGAEVVRAALLSGGVRGFGASVEAVLFAAARTEHVDRRIRPALAAGRWVICDRFIDSTRVYQGLAGVEMAFLADLEAIAVGEIRPDLTIVLDLPPELGLARAATRRAAATADRFEGDPVEEHARRRDAFLAVARREPARCAVVDADAPAETVAAAVRRAVASRFGVAFADAA